MRRWLELSQELVTRVHDPSDGEAILAAVRDFQRVRGCTCPDDSWALKEISPPRVAANHMEVCPYWQAQMRAHFAEMN